jgi:ArsR family transcriptional regulator
LSVSDLARALAQSEPRVSRHLRILCNAGLLERVRQGQWVHYRLTRETRALSFIQGLLGQLDRADAALARDRERARPQPGTPAEAAKSIESRLGRALRGFVEAHAPGQVGSVLLVGVEHLELLESSVVLAGQCTAIAHSRRAAQSARAFAARHAITPSVLLAASPEGLSERDLQRAGGPFDAILLDHLASPESDLGSLLALSRRALAPSGQLWLFERYDSLAATGRSRSQPQRPRGQKVIEHPLGRLRRLLNDCGLTCERLSPFEADGEHVLAALATVSVAASGVPRAS